MGLLLEWIHNKGTVVIHCGFMMPYEVGLLVNTGSGDGLLPLVPL